MILLFVPQPRTEYGGLSDEPRRGDQWEKKGRQGTEGEKQRGEGQMVR